MGILDYLAGGGGILGTIADNNLRMKQEEDEQFKNMQQGIAQGAMIRALKANPMEALARYAEKGYDPNKFNSLLDYNKPPAPQAAPSFIQEMQYMGIPKDQWKDYYSAQHTKSGMSFVTNPDGTVSFEQGPGVGGITKTAASQLEKDIIEGGDLSMQLTGMENSFKPEYHTLGPRVGAKASNFLESINPDALTPDQKQGLADYTTYQSNVADTQTAIINSRAGASQSPTEIERMKPFLVQPGDGPTAAETKIKKFNERVRWGIARKQYIRQNGLNDVEIPIEQMPRVIRERGDQIERELQTQGLSGAPLSNAVRRKLNQEFGL